MSHALAVQYYRVYARKGRYVIPVAAGIGEALVVHLRSLGIACRVRRRAGVPGERVRVEQDGADGRTLQTIVDHWTR